MLAEEFLVSMKSGLEGRNNRVPGLSKKAGSARSQ